MNTKLKPMSACLLGVMLLLHGRLPVRGDTIQDVKHVVIMMQENRSFDHYFGTLQGVRGFNDPNIVLQPNGSSVLFHPAGGTNFILPFPVTNNCLTGGGYTWFTYYNRTNLSFYYALADAYTICDAKFCSFYGPTFPNRLYLFTGTIDAAGLAGGPALNNSVPTNGYSWTTYPERLQAAGVSWKVYRPPGDWFGDALQWFTQYQNASPGNPLYDRGMATVPDVIAAFRSDVTNGTLPQVSWIIPPDLGWSEHPPAAMGKGEWFVEQLLNALAANPAVANSTVFILTYDENGAFQDHIPRPQPPVGTVGEVASGGLGGLGIRVPMIIVSPWTRGGRVCSQVFDHTSIIRFLETWTGVQETNISAWRRQTCGDLTSAFNFSSPDTSNPNLPVIPFTDCDSFFSPTVPAVQLMPLQESGVKPACPLPYQPDASCSTDCGSNRLFVTLTNAGTAAVHFAVYANTDRAGGPWQYDVPPGGTVSDAFGLPNDVHGHYDFTCYGPNGFQRRFAGSLAADCSQLEITTLIDPVAGITVGLVNASTNPVNFTITDNLNSGTALLFALSSAGVTNNTFPVLINNQGWYDLTVTADADTNFLRHLAGHIENGAFSITEAPAIVGDPLLVPTNPPPVIPPVVISIYDVVRQLIAQNSLATAGTNFLALTVGAYGGSCALIYPGWASNFVVQSSATLNPPLWTPLNAPMTVVSNCNVILLPATNPGAFFQLSQ